MTTENLNFLAAGSAAGRESPRLEEGLGSPSFRRTLDDQRRWVEEKRNDDPEPAKGVSEARESTQRAKESLGDASGQDEAEAGEKPRAASSDESIATSDQARRDGESDAAVSERPKDRAAHGTTSDAQSAQDSAQNMRARPVGSFARVELAQDEQSNLSGIRSERGSAAQASAPAGPTIGSTPTTTSTSGEPNPVTQEAGAATVSRSDAQATTSRTDGQPVLRSAAQTDMRLEQGGSNDSGRRFSGHAAQPPFAATGSPSSEARPIEDGGSREGKPTPDALTQLRALIEKTTENGAARSGRQSLAPAGARAVQIENSLQVEQLTGQQASSEVQAASGAKAPSPLLPGQISALGVKADGADAGLPMRNAADESLFSERIIRGLSAMVNQRGGVMNMKLHPAELGSLRVQMSIVQGTVSAHFVASTPEAQMMLDRSLGTLRAALENHGLHVERISVTHAPADSSGASTRQDAHDQQSAGRDHDAGKGESRGRQDGGRQDGGDQRNRDSRFPFDRHFSSFQAGTGSDTEGEPGGDS